MGAVPLGARRARVISASTRSVPSLCLDCRSGVHLRDRFRRPTIADRAEHILRPCRHEGRRRRKHRALRRNFRLGQDDLGLARCFGFRNPLSGHRYLASVGCSFHSRSSPPEATGSTLQGSPLRGGDLIEAAGETGEVQNLNTRSTVLLTLDGNHVQIKIEPRPNPAAQLR